MPAAAHAAHDISGHGRLRVHSDVSLRKIDCTRPDLGLVVWVRGLGDNPSPLVASSGPSVRLRRPPVLMRPRSRRGDRAISTLDREQTGVFSVAEPDSAVLSGATLDPCSSRSHRGTRKATAFCGVRGRLSRRLCGRVCAQGHAAEPTRANGPMRGRILGCLARTGRTTRPSPGNSLRDRHGNGLCEDMRGALVDMAPVFVTEGGVGGWRPKSGHCMKRGAARRGERQCTAWGERRRRVRVVFRVRTDFLLPAPNRPCAIFQQATNAPPLQRKQHGFFSGASCASRAVFKGKRTPYHKSFPARRRAH